MKRSFDFLGALLALLALLPLGLIIGLLIKVTDFGPVLFKQERVGKGGHLFILYKFRSMSVSNEARNGLFTPGDCSRITYIGRILRKTKLDELPQLINILKGEMSFVGPRPEVKQWVDEYPERWRRVLTVLPGITDFASIKFRNEEELLNRSESPEDTYRHVILPQKLTLNEMYVANQSLIGDLKLMLKTIYVCIFK